MSDRYIDELDVRMDAMECAADLRSAKLRRDNPTHSQHKYYRAAILPHLREMIGCESDAEAHRQVKAGFYDMHPDDPKLPSMAAMSGDEVSRFIDYAIRQAAEMGRVIENPREVGGNGKA